MHSPSTYVHITEDVRDSDEYFMHNPSTYVHITEDVRDSDE